MPGASFRGADALQMSRSVVSRLVAELEGRLGVRLLQRTTRRLSLTREGELFHERCKDLMSGVGDAEVEVTRHAGEVIGELRVSAPVAFGLMHLAPLWPVFMARHPKLTLDVTLADRFVDLVDEGYDLAVRVGQLPSSSSARQWSVARLAACPAFAARPIRDATPGRRRVVGPPTDRRPGVVPETVATAPGA